MTFPVRLRVKVAIWLISGQEGLNGVNRRRQTAKNLVDSRNDWNILTVSSK